MKYQTMPAIGPDHLELSAADERRIRKNPTWRDDEIWVHAAIAKAQWMKWLADQRPIAVDTRAVYFLNAPLSSLVKIGVATSPISRLREIQHMSPEPLFLIGSTSGGQPREQELHRMFGSIRSHGEWFRATSDLLDFIEREVKK